MAAGLSLANGVYGLLVLPESLPAERRAPFAWRRANPFGALRLLRSQPQLSGLAAVNFLGNLAHASLPSISVLYIANTVLCLDRGRRGARDGAGMSSCLLSTIAAAFSPRRRSYHFCAIAATPPPLAVAGGTDPRIPRSVALHIERGHR